jgi:hypothetical protein
MRPGARPMPSLLQSPDPRALRVRGPNAGDVSAVARIYIESWNAGCAGLTRERWNETKVAQRGYGSERATSAGLVELSRLKSSLDSYKSGQAATLSIRVWANSIQFAVARVSGVTRGSPLVYPQPTRATNVCSDRPCGRYAVFDSACDMRLQTGHGMFRELSVSRPSARR